jgi:hypothetical protein
MRSRTSDRAVIRAGRVAVRRGRVAVRKAREVAMLHLYSVVENRLSLLKLRDHLEERQTQSPCASHCSAMAHTAAVSRSGRETPNRG